jgi:preprotein translocase subunit SecG
MLFFLKLLHIFSSLFLVFVVLLQSGKGADMGAAFGGASQTMFGSAGASSFLTKLTVGAAVIFMATAVILSYTGRQVATDSIMESAPIEAPVPIDEAIPTPTQGEEIPSAVIPDSEGIAPEPTGEAGVVPAAAADSAPPAAADSPPPSADSPADVGQPAAAEPLEQGAGENP